MSIKRIAESVPNVASQINEPDTSPVAEKAGASFSGIGEVSDSIEQAKSSSFVSEVASNGGAVDPNALVQYVLRESYTQTTEDLRFYAEKVKYFNDCKELLRDELSQAGLLSDELKGKFEDSSSNNPMEVVLETLKQSIDESNADKQYYLGKAQELVQLETHFAASRDGESNTQRPSDDD